MNAWKNHRLSFLLASGSLLLLLLFQGFWLRNIYQNEKETLREEADLIFDNAVRSIEDSLFHTLIIDTDLMEMAKHTEATVKKIITPNEGMIKSTAQEIKIMEGDTMINFKIDLRSDFKKEDDKKSFGSVALWMASTKDSVSPHDHTEMFNFSGNNFEVIKKELAVLMEQSNLPKPYEVVTLEDGKVPEGELYSNPHFNILSKNSYAIFFPDFKNYVFQKILPQILFSIFLFGAILFSFFMVWQSLEKQRRLTELKNDFISNVTHELKTPITTVGVALEALSNFNALKNPERTEEYINISKHELQRLSLLVDKVLKMSLFEKKEPELKLEVFDMHALVQDVLHSMKLQFEKFSANVKFDFEGSDFSIKGDKIHLTNVVYNLIDNALKYSKDNPEITLLLKQQNGQINLVVKDRGVGIEPNLKDKIFEKFFRVPQGDLHDVKGYGLGLSYVASVIKKHQGNIEVDSEPHQGTAFSVSLPTNYG